MVTHPLDRVSFDLIVNTGTVMIMSVDHLAFCSILIIDDNEADVFYAKCMFKKMNLELNVLTCRNGEEAVSFFENYEANKKLFGDDFPPLLIMLDINMPLMNGWEFLDEYVQRFANHPNYSSAIFVMFSSSVSPQDLSRVQSYDCVKGYLNKPLSIDGFEKVIEKYLN